LEIRVPQSGLYSQHNEHLKSIFQFSSSTGLIDPLFCVEGSNTSVLTELKPQVLVSITRLVDT
jgi:hypothetical protein